MASIALQVYTKAKQWMVIFRACWRTQTIHLVSLFFHGGQKSKWGAWGATKAVHSQSLEALTSELQAALILELRNAVTTNLPLVTIHLQIPVQQRMSPRKLHLYMPKIQRKKPT